MDVRCERCRAQYEFGDDQVGPAGLTVRCSKCGHVFMVKKKQLVVTMPVKAGELRDAPVSTADIERAPAASGGAAAKGAGAWSLRNRRGAVYPFKDLATLQKWIVERKAARDDEISHQGGSWRRLGDMPELEPFFALVDRVARAPAAVPSSAVHPERSFADGGAEPKGKGPASQPTLIAFPAARPVPPGSGREPAPEKAESTFQPPTPPKAERPGRPEPVPDEGPVLPERVASVAAPEPAWTANRDERPGVQQEQRPEKPRPRAAKGLRIVPIAVLVGLAVAAVAVYLTNPGWLGLEPAKPGPAQAPVSPAPGPTGSETPGKPPEPSEAAPAPGQAAPPAPAPVRPQAPPPSPTTQAPPSAPTQAAPSPSPQAVPSPAIQAPSSPSPPVRTQASPSPQAPSPGQPQASPSTSPSTATAEPPPSTAKGEARGQEQGRKDLPAQVDSSAAEPPKAPEAARKKPLPAARSAEPNRPPSLKRLLADARRLRERGKPDAALDAYGRAVELEPQNADALAGRGLCYLELSRYAPAEASFQAALEADAQHAGALMGLAETYRYEGRRTEAVTYYRKYLAAHPDGPDAVAARNAIDALKE